MSKFKKLPRIVINGRVHKLSIATKHIACKDCSLYKEQRCYCLSVLDAVNPNGIVDQSNTTFKIDKITPIDDDSVILSVNIKDDLSYSEEWNEERIKTYKDN